MFTKFFAIDTEKQERIINAAYKEFAGKSYSLASTNEIAKEAGISKGLLFHYFTSKKELYLYLYDYAVKFLSEEIKEKVDAAERDLFVKLRQTSRVKLSIFERFPDMFQFLKQVFYEEEAAIKVEIQQRNKGITSNEYSRLLADIDTTKFKEGIDVGRAINVILWTLEGMGEREREKHRLLGKELDIPSVMDEFDKYLELLQNSFYS